MKKITAAITGVGAYLPDYLLTNDELSRMVDTSDEWIMTRIGIKTRHILKGEALGTSYMGVKAVRDLLEKKNMNPEEIDLVICATVTPAISSRERGWVHLIWAHAPSKTCWKKPGLIRWRSTS
mgnify:CR=1 FL=1